MKWLRAWLRALFGRDDDQDIEINQSVSRRVQASKEIEQSE